MKTFKVVLGDNPRRLVIMPVAGDITDALYCIGDLPPRYPVPAIWHEPRCLFCGSVDGLCRMHPMDCLEGQFFMNSK